MSESSTGKESAIQSGNVKYSQISKNEERIDIPNELLEKEHQDDVTDERTCLQVLSDSEDAKKLEDVKLSDIDEPYAPPYKQTTAPYVKVMPYSKKEGPLKTPVTFLLFSLTALLLNPLFGLIALCLTLASYTMNDATDEDIKVARRLGIAAVVVGSIGIFVSATVLIVLMALYV